MSEVLRVERQMREMLIIIGNFCLLEFIYYSKKLKGFEGDD